MLDDAKKIMQKNKKNILIAPASSGPTTMWNISYFIDLMKFDQLNGYIIRDLISIEKISEYEILLIYVTNNFRKKPLLRI